MAAAAQLVDRLRAQTAAAAETYADDLLIHTVALAIREENPAAKTLTLISNEHDMLEMELDGEYATESMAGSTILERAYLRFRRR